MCLNLKQVLLVFFCSAIFAACETGFDASSAPSEQESSSEDQPPITSPDKEEDPDGPMAPADPTNPEEPADPIPEEPMEPELPSPPTPAACDLTQVGVAATADDGNVPANMLDGNLNTRWSAEGIGQSATFDLRRVVTLERLKISFYVGDQRRTNFRIAVSTDGAQFSEIYQGASSGLSLDLETFPVQAADIRFVRYIGYGNKRNDWNSVTEIDFTATMCGPLLAAGPIPMPTPPQAPPSDPDPASANLRGNPDFNLNQLSTVQRLWYQRALAGIHGRHYDDEATSGDLYFYARDLHTYYQSLLLAFRFSGDLSLLDELVRLTEIQKSKLRDGWSKTLDGKDQKDGYPNWVWHYDDKNADHYGKDLNMMDDLRTHSILTTIAYTLTLNRDLKSPKGYDYGKLGDAWLVHIQDNFFKKWRGRNKVSGSSYRVFEKAINHATYSIMKLNLNWHQLTGETGYLNEAKHWAGFIWQDVKEVDADTGRAYVWPHGVISMGGSQFYLVPSVYSRYSFADMIEFHLDGFHDRQDLSHLEKFIRAVTDFVIGDGTKVMSRDIGGNVARGGYPSKSNYADMNFLRYRMSPFAHLTAWDRTGKMRKVNEKVYDQVESNKEAPKEIYIPVGLYVDAVMNNR